METNSRGDSHGRPPLLFLCHRIPFPPNKGDKIRSFHLLRELARDFSVHLVAFVDDAADWQYSTELSAYCSSVSCLPLNPTLATIFSALGLLTGEALSLHYYASARMQRQVNELLERYCIDRAFVFSSVMGRFLPSDPELNRIVVDFVDVDSDKWRQYARRKRWPLSWVYRRESLRLLEYERELARRADASLLVSECEADLFRSLCSDASVCIGHVDNGVDADFFSPDAKYDNPYPAGAKVLVFTGAMDYWPNVDAVMYFSEEVFPRLLARDPSLQFWIVGGKPSAEVCALACDAVHITGRVPDVRPFLNYAIAAVAPMRIARGVQNKVLEAMAMCRPVLVSACGLEGISARSGEELLLCETVDDYLDALELLSRKGGQTIGACARRYVLEHCDWIANLEPVRGLLAGTTDPELLPWN